MDKDEREKLRKRLHSKINDKSLVRKSTAQKEQILEKQGIDKNKIDEAKKMFDTLPKEQRDMLLKLMEQRK